MENTGNKVVAVAAGKEITEAEFAQFAARIPQEQQAYIRTPEGRKQALTQYANYFLFEKYGLDEKLDETEEFQAILANAKRELLSQYALTQAVKDAAATREECEEYYHAHPEQFKKGAQANAKHILVDTEERANEIKEELARGEKTFEEAAQAYSSCPSGQRGGDLGTFGRGAMVKEFDEAVFGGETGVVIGPVKTQFGYHLIRVESLEKEGAAPLSEVMGKIGQTLAAEKQNKIYMELRAKLIERYGFELR